MTHKIINTKEAPKPIGPYSQAVEINGFIFTSGQIALNPQTGEIESNEIESQVRQVILNLKNILKESGSGLEKVLKTTIYLKDMEHFTPVNTIYSEFFGNSKPARSTVQVSRLPKDVLIEIDCIAAK
jgi:2-iminobutanoate/2-iminopropanoate deaminase